MFKNSMRGVFASNEGISQKKLAKKVDWYERHYGFVPRNVMTEAEWQAARDRAPKVKPARNPLTWRLGNGGAGAAVASVVGKAGGL